VAHISETVATPVEVDEETADLIGLLRREAKLKAAPMLFDVNAIAA
jgi:hypothetical protein